MEQIIHSNKALMRKSVREKVLSLSENDKQRQSLAVCEKLKAFADGFQSKNVLMFMPLRDEINIIPFTEYLLDNSYNVYIPVSFTESIMKFYKITSVNVFELGMYGIREPKKEYEYEYSPIDNIIVPGVLFDKHCNRLGRGKGYYDIFLSRNPLNSIAVCYNEQIIEEMVTEPHDYKVNYVLSESFDIKK